MFERWVCKTLPNPYKTSFQYLVKDYTLVEAGMLESQETRMLGGEEAGMLGSPG
jgi:hypothetical protein